MSAKPLEPNSMVKPAMWSRRRTGVVLLAVVALVALIRLRGTCESVLSLGSELALQVASLITWLWWSRQRAVGVSQAATYGRPGTLTAVASSHADRRIYDHHPNPDLLPLMIIGLWVALVPWWLQLCLRAIGHGTGLELVAMSSFGWATLLGSLSAQRSRSLGTAVVCSGFLTLLATCSSEQTVALVLAFVWGAVCLWWLASSQWERALRCQVSTVHESVWQRPVVVVAGCLVFALSAWSVAGRFPPAQKLPWEVAPTSGGTGQTDDYARSGVGDGDALVAARENASSFGAVDSDLLLDSQEASLFDLYSDTFGEPVRKNDVERTIALAPQQPEEMAEANQMAQSDGASAALTTQRRPGKPHQTLNDRPSDAVLFWIGRPDTHLALERFSAFDGIQWTPPRPEADSPTEINVASAATDQKILPTPHGNKTWFAAERTSSAATLGADVFCGSCAEAIKYARLRSPRIPTVSGMHSWHIHQVDDGSFFRMDQNDNLTMTGRKSVPEYTIVRYVNRETDLESLVQSFDQISKNSSVSEASTGGQLLARQLVRQWQQEFDPSSPWDMVQTVISRLRQEFRLDRTLDTSGSNDPLADFLTQRAGSELMFATAAGVMLRELGYSTRLVTGFLARKENRLNWTQELAVYAGDTHAWIEVQAGQAWIPLEPSPNYPQPIYRISWRYWFWLHAWSMVLGVLAVTGVLTAGYLQRGWLFDCGCRLLALVWWLPSDRQRCRLLLMILDSRSGLAGYKRPAHVSPGRWYKILVGAPEPLVTRAIAQSTDLFFREADRLWFGKQAMLSPTAQEACRVLWTQTSCRMMRSVFRSSSASTNHSQGT